MPNDRGDEHVGQGDSGKDQAGIIGRVLKGDDEDDETPAVMVGSESILDICQ